MELKDKTCIEIQIDIKTLKKIINKIKKRKSGVNK